MKEIQDMGVFRLRVIRGSNHSSATGTRLPAAGGKAGGERYGGSIDERVGDVLTVTAAYRSYRLEGPPVGDFGVLGLGIEQRSLPAPSRRSEAKQRAPSLAGSPLRRTTFFRAETLLKNLPKFVFMYYLRS